MVSSSNKYILNVTFTHNPTLKQSDILYQRRSFSASGSDPIYDWVSLSLAQADHIWQACLTLWWIPAFEVRRVFTTQAISKMHWLQLTFSIFEPRRMELQRTEEKETNRHLPNNCWKKAEVWNWRCQPTIRNVNECVMSKQQIKKCIKNSDTH